MKSYIGLNESVHLGLKHMIAAMFPRFYGEEAKVDVTEEEKSQIESKKALSEITKAFSYVMDEGAEETASILINKLPTIKAVLETDIDAAYKGDPAAKDADVIILAYPAFKAISTYRIAHELYLMKIPVIPRIMSEYAHYLTGIDIHPGATIGTHFFIDHGTGVVIGETTVIGEHVKLYQHVTLGAKSFDVNDDGSLVKGIKRHPNIGNNVVIYAGATILGGDTYIGDGCIIGGNVWLTHSLNPGSTITVRLDEHNKQL